MIDDKTMNFEVERDNSIKAKEILKVPNEKVRAKAMEYLSELNDGKRDFRF